MTEIGEAITPVGQRGARRTERQPAVASSAGVHGLFKAADPRIEIINDVEQRSPEWFELRRGIPTASRFAQVIATGREDGTPKTSKTRQQLLRVLAGEILSGDVSETFRNEATDRGTAMEAEAREHYEQSYFVEVRRVGFIRRQLPSGRWVGCSPDGVIGERRALEIKTTRPDLLIEVLDKGAAGFPPEHRAQLQGTLWIAGLDEADLYIFYRNMRAAKFTVQRDEQFIRSLSDSVEVFDWELHKLVERMR
jgi:hypothetical protein